MKNRGSLEVAIAKHIVQKDVVLPSARARAET